MSCHTLLHRSALALTEIFALTESCAFHGLRLAPLDPALLGQLALP